MHDASRCTVNSQSLQPIATIISATVAAIRCGDDRAVYLAHAVVADIAYTLVAMAILNASQPSRAYCVECVWNVYEMYDPCQFHIL